MNRPIKFRVWDGRQMSYATRLTNRVSFDSGGHPYLSWYLDRYGVVVHGDIEVSQFTGLTLPNGTEIYEGDILNTKAARWEVVFEKGAFVAKWLMGLGDKDTRHILWPMMEHAILAGNRFEHPDLLKDLFTTFKEAAQ
jgi:hypothetical protein